MTADTWRRVTRAEPCPICGKPDWCGRSPDGSAAVCMRVESPYPTRNGGWLHHLQEHPPPPRPAPRRPAPASSAPDVEILWRKWRDATTAERRTRLAASLGIGPAAIEALRAAWAPPHLAWAFPMQDAAGRTVGIRLRAEDGRKWSVRGGREGLFVPDRPPSPCVTVCEGPTDTAAAVELGLFAIGRPSCTGAVDLTVAFLRAGRFARAVIVADADAPGRAGAARLAGKIPIPHAVIVPPAKDLRAWVAAGAGRAAFDTLLRHARWRCT